MAETPHFDLPFRFTSSGHAVVVEQDSDADVLNCVEAIVLTTIGQRIESPGFGIPDPTFSSQPLEVGVITDAILEQEQRASIQIETAPDAFDSLIADVLINTTVRQEGAQT